MFFSGSRYEKTATYVTKLSDGRQVTAVKMRLPVAKRLAGFHVKKQGQRLDHIAARYLGDATRFWSLCDANSAMLPDALAAHEQIGVPVKS